MDDPSDRGTSERDRSQRGTSRRTASSRGRASGGRGPGHGAGPPFWVTLIPGAFNLIFGLIVLLEPHSSLVAVAIVIGIYLLIVSAVVIVAAVNRPGNDWGLVAVGVIGVLAALFVIFRPGSALHGVRIVLGIYLLIAGGANALSAWREDSMRRTLGGAAELIAGLVLLFWPGIGLTAFALIVGVYLIVRGGLELYLAITVRDERARAARL